MQTYHCHLRRSPVCQILLILQLTFLLFPKTCMHVEIPYLIGRIANLWRPISDTGPPHWHSGWGVRLESERSRVRIPLVPGFFSGLSHTSDLKIGTPVATLPGAWRYRVSAGTGRRGVSILWLGEMESLICNFYLSVAARKIVWAGLSLRYTSMLLGR